MSREITEVNIFFNNNVNNHLNIDDWIKICQSLNETSEKKFNIHLSDLSKCNNVSLLISYFNKNHINYSVNIDWINHIFDDLIALIDSVNGIKTLILNYDLKNSNSYELDLFNKINIKNNSLFIKSIVSRLTIQSLHKFISDLSKIGITTIIQSIDTRKCKDYDGIPFTVDFNDMLSKDEPTLKIFKKIFCDETLLINDRMYLIKMINSFPSNMFCNIHENCKHIVSVDGDGSLRLCPVIKGTKMKRRTIKHIYDESIIFDMSSDYRNLCKGCISSDMLSKSDG